MFFSICFHNCIKKELFQIHLEDDDIKHPAVAWKFTKSNYNNTYKITSVKKCYVSLHDIIYNLMGT